jgi:HEAT repeat protein
MRFWCATGLGQLSGGEEDVKALEKAGKDNSATVRIAAAGSLGRLGQTRSAVAILTDILKQDHPHQLIMQRAVEALDEIGKPAAAALDLVKKVLGGTENRFLQRLCDHFIETVETTGKSDD